MKRILALLLALVMCLSLCACGSKEEIVELTTENISEYLSFSKKFSGGTVEETTEKILGISFTTFEGKGTYTLEAARNDNVGFQDVTVEIKLIVGDGRGREEWKFASGGKQESRFSDDVGRFVKTVKMNISYDGIGSVTENMILDLSGLAIEFLVPPPDLSKSVSYEIISVTGNAIITK